MFALGGRSFTKRLATDLSMDLDEAERFKVAHSEGHLAAEQSAMARRALTPTAEVLAQGVALTLEELAGPDPLPGPSASLVEEPRSPRSRSSFASSTGRIPSRSHVHQPSRSSDRVT